jgi:hypothetical protein
MAWHVEMLIAGDQFNSRIFGVTADCGEDIFQSTANGDSRTLADTGLTSTEIARLGIDTSGDLFAAIVL